MTDCRLNSPLSRTDSVVTLVAVVMVRIITACIAFQSMHVFSYVSNLSFICIQHVELVASTANAITLLLGILRMRIPVLFLPLLPSILVVHACKKSLITSLAKRTTTLSAVQKK